MSWPHRYSSLWHMIAAPIVWAIHFGTVYGWTAAICARAGAPGAARSGISVATLVALAAIAWLGWRAWLQWDYRPHAPRLHDVPTTEARREFLGHAAWLLSIVSAIGVIFVALPAIFIESCL